MSMACILLLTIANFYSCKKTKQDTLTYAAFDSLDFKIDPNGATIVSFRGDNLKNLVIPATYQGKPVTGIVANLFNYELLLKNKIVLDKDTQDTINGYLKTTFLMETITLPVHMANIGSKAFAIPSLHEVKSLNPTPPNLGTGVFTTEKTLTIYVPVASLEAYQAQWTTDKIGTANVEWKTL